MRINKLKLWRLGKSGHGLFVNVFIVGDNTNDFVAKRLETNDYFANDIVQHTSIPAIPALTGMM